jgi:acid stress chaperone HdeB
MRRLASTIIAVAGICFLGQAQAAEVDMSQLTCKEVGAMPAAKTLGVAMWVNGYVHGKAGNPKIDGEQAHSNAEKAVAFCKSNPDTTLAEAIETAAKS